MKKVKHIIKKHRATFLRYHLYISLFFLPLALMYKITGIVCIFGYFGGVDRQAIALDETQKHFFSDFMYPLDVDSSNADRESARAKILAFLAQNQITIPLNTNLYDSRDKNHFILGSTHHSVEVAKSSPRQILICKNDFLANLVALHFSRAGVGFSILAFCFVVFMGITYITGLLMCDFRKNGKKYLFTIVLGFVISATLGIYGLTF
ncbi:hypothetical protein [Helicobacter sp. T3_23-1059]